MSDDRNAPVTKGDLEDLESRLKGGLKDQESRFDDKLENLESRLEGKLDAQEQRILDRVEVMIRDSETRLLQAFYAYAKTNDKRVLETEGNEAALRSRMATLETRVLDLEEKRNTPPQP